MRAPSLRPGAMLIAGTLAASSLVALTVSPALAATTPPAALAAAPTGVVINEIDTAEDWVEILNTGTEVADLSGSVLKDDDDTRTLALPAGTLLEPGQRVVVDVGDEVAHGSASYGLGKSDSARLYAPDATTLLDSYSWTQHPATTYGRCDDGTGAFVVTVTGSRDAPNVCSVSAADAVVVNEIESKDGDPGDWVELKNISTVPVDASGLVLSDSKGTPSYTIPAGTSIAADGYLVLDEAAFGFDLGGEDLVRLHDTDGTTVIDEHSWAEHSTTTLGRCPDGAGPFTATASPTKGAANDCAAPGATADLVVNEVESNGDDTDWVELTTTGAGPVDISGFTFRDDDDARTPYTLPAGSVVEPGAFFVIDQVSGSNPVGFDFGLGNADSVRLYDTTGALVADYSWTVHSLVTYGRCPDGTGDMTTTTVSTKGAPNDCSSPVRINEVSTSGDWVELTSIGASAVPLDGYTLATTDGSGTTPVPTGTSLAPAGFLALDLPVADAGTLQLLTGDGTVVDEHTWTAEAAASYGRCPDGTGAFTTTLAATRGTANACEGVLTPQPWPGGPDEIPLDEDDTFTGDLSGLDYEPSGSAAPGTLWAVQNGDGLLYKIAADGTGGWAPTTDAGWAAGKTLRYPDGGGAVDAEGVTVVADSSEGGVYVSTERNNDQSSVSRPSVLRYDVTGGATTMVATDEWNLAADFPGLGANAGLEGITWVPDAFLTAQGFVDQRTGAAYAAASYPGHGDGLFLVGVEGTAGVYAYALLDDGGFVRVAEMETPFDLVADVQFDADLEALWVVCDEACSGRTALFEVDTTGAFAATAVYERGLRDRRRRHLRRRLARDLLRRRQRHRRVLAAHRDLPVRGETDRTRGAWRAHPGRAHLGRAGSADPRWVCARHPWRSGHPRRVTGSRDHPCRHHAPHRRDPRQHLRTDDRRPGSDGDDHGRPPVRGPDRLRVAALRAEAPRLARRGRRRHRPRDDPGRRPCRQPPSRRPRRDRRDHRLAGDRDRRSSGCTRACG
jgi:hypothetical protein